MTDWNSMLSQSPARLHWARLSQIQSTSVLEYLEIRDAQLFRSAVSGVAAVVRPLRCSTVESSWVVNADSIPLPRRGATKKIR